MASCYSDEVVFEDPAFGKLKGYHAKAMWQMLFSRDNKPEFTFEIIEASVHSGKVKWTAKYNYGKHKRRVVNHVVGTFRIENDKTIRLIRIYEGLIATFPSKEGSYSL